jgi:hypothetical protein
MRTLILTLAVLVLVSGGCSEGGEVSVTEAQPKPAAPPTGVPGGEAPRASDCRKLWNRSANETNQRDVVEAGFRLAAAYGWMDKADDLGCGVIFWKELNGEWAIYAATVPRLMDSPDEWEALRGERWGVDSPEGDIPSSSDSRVESDGTLTE